MLLTSVACDVVAPIVEQMGGTLRIGSDEAVARFGEEQGWTLECRFALASPRQIATDAPMSTKMVYHGPDDPRSVFARYGEYSAAIKFWPQRRACEAMLRANARFHHRSLDRIKADIVALRAKHGVILPVELEMASLGNDWSVLFGEQHGLCRFLPDTPYLLYRNAVYVPAAEVQFPKAGRRTRRWHPLEPVQDLILAKRLRAAHAAG